MKKMLMIMIAAMVLFGNTASAATVIPVVEENTTGISDFVRGLFAVTEKPEWDEIVYSVFDKLEGKTSIPETFIYEGKEEDCDELVVYFNMNYSYHRDIHLHTLVYSDGTCRVYLAAIDDVPSVVEAYLTEAKLSQEIAASLKTEDTDQTIANIIEWVQENIEIQHEYTLDSSIYQYYYGVYHGNPAVCGGFAIAVYQLCSINGIHATIEYTMTTSGEPHAINTVTYSDQVRYVDALSKTPVSDTLWDTLVP